jgi:chromosome segregation ATPase
MKHGLTVLRSEFQELQSKCADLLLANSAPSDSISDVFAETPPTDFMTTFIRERIEELLSEKISSTQPSVFPENQHHDNIKHFPSDNRAEQRECRADRSTSPLCSRDPIVPQEFSKEQTRKTKNIGKLVRALAMCMKLIDGGEQNLRDRDRTIKRYEESLKSMTEKVAVLSKNNRELAENAECMEDKLQQHIDQLVNEKELHMKKIAHLEESCIDMQERAENSNSYLTLLKENLEDYKSRCKALGVELDQHRRLTDECMAQRNTLTLEGGTQSNLFQKSDDSAKQNLYQLLSEKDRFIKTLQEKLNESRSRLQAKDLSKAEEALKTIQLEHSEALSMLKQIKGGFFTRSHENDQLTDARRQIYQAQQEKRFVEEKYAASVGEIDRLKHDMETLSSNMMELKGKFDNGEKQYACMKALKTKDLEIYRLRSTVKSLQKACASKDSTGLSVEMSVESERKIKSLSDNLEKTSKSLLEYKRSKAKSDELLHEATQRLQIAQDVITKKDKLESKLRQNLAEALSAKLNALEKARKATDKLKALKERCSKDLINSDLITKQRVEINDLKLKMASLRGVITKQSSS